MCGAKVGEEARNGGSVAQMRQHQGSCWYFFFLHEVCDVKLKIDIKEDQIRFQCSVTKMYDSTNTILQRKRAVSKGSLGYYVE